MTLGRDRRTVPFSGAYLEKRPAIFCKKVRGILAGRRHRHRGNYGATPGETPSRALPVFDDGKACVAAKNLARLEPLLQLKRVS